MRAAKVAAYVGPCRCCEREAQTIRTAYRLCENCYSIMWKTVEMARFPLAYTPAEVDALDAVARLALWRSVRRQFVHDMGLPALEEWLGVDKHVVAADEQETWVVVAGIRLLGYVGRVFSTRVANRGVEYYFDDEHARELVTRARKESEDHVLAQKTLALENVSG